MHDPMEWCVPGCGCKGMERATQCPFEPGCPNCLEVVGMMGFVVGPLGLVLVRVLPGDDGPQDAIERLLSETEQRWVH